MKMLATAMVIGCLCLSGSAQAEKYEKRVSLSGLMGMPLATNPGGFLVGWGSTGGFEYSPAHDIWVGAQFSASQFPGALADHSTTLDGRDYSGTLTYTGQYYHPQLTLRYELLSGWRVAPHLEVAAGYMYLAYNEAEMVDQDNNKVVDAKIEGQSGGALTVQVALLANVRLFDMLQIGTGVALLHVLDDHYGTALHVPLRISYYWY